MKTVSFTLATVLMLGAAAPAFAQPRDTGNMAYPAPLPQGQVGSTANPATPRDTGNMAYPAPLPQGQIGTTRVGPGGGTPTDTGSMGSPAGQGGTTTRTR